MRYIAWLFALGLAVVLVIVVLGIRVPRTHHIEETIEIGAPPLAVWRMISDVQAAPQWRPTVKRVDVLDAKRWREYGRMGTITYRLGDITPEHRRVAIIDDKNLPYTGQWTWTLQPLENGHTRLTIAEDATVFNPVWRFFGHYVIGERRSIDEYLADLQRAFRYSTPPSQ